MKKPWVYMTGLLVVILGSCGGNNEGLSSQLPINQLPVNLLPVNLEPFSLANIQVGKTRLNGGTSGTMKNVQLTWQPSSTLGNANVAYTICEYDVTQNNNCNALAQVTGGSTAVVEWGQLLTTILGAEFFILAGYEAQAQPSDQRQLTAGEVATMIGYLKASNTDSSDEFGRSVSLSDDGTVLAVGALFEASNATGVNGDELDNSAFNSGAVYVYRYSGGSWAQEAYLKASNTEGGDEFGISVSLSGDGTVLAVGARREDSNATGINGDELDNSVSNAGAVYVYRYSGGSWAQEAYLKASNTDSLDEFGENVSLSGDGTVLAVGASGEASSATGINGNELDNSASDAGAVYVYRYSSGSWAQEAYIKASNTGSSDEFGGSVSLNNDGMILAVGAVGENSNATGINGNESNDTFSNSGAVYVYRYSGVSWAQEAYIKASNTGAGDEFGGSVSLNNDGTILAVGAQREDSNATGINGNELDNSASDAGAVYVYRYSGSSWAQEAYLKASNTGSLDLFGARISLSGDGTILAVGAIGEASNAMGINGNDSDDSFTDSGAAYVYRYSGGSWAQEAYLKASNTNDSDQFGGSVSLSSDGTVLAVGAEREDSNATGINGDELDNTASDAGAVYLY